MRPLKVRQLAKGLALIVGLLLLVSPPVGAVQKALVSLNVEEGEGEVAVLLQVKGGVEKYRYFLLEDPPRLVIDLHGVRRAKGLKGQRVSSALLRGVRFGDYPDKARVVLDLTEGCRPAFKVERFEGGLRVQLAMVDPLIQHFGFRQMEGISRVFVKARGPLRYTVEEGVKEVVVELPGYSFPRRFLRPLDTREFNSPVRWVRPSNTRKGAKIVVELREKVPFEVKKERGLLAIDFTRVGPYAAPGKPKVVKVARKVEPEKAQVSPVERLIEGQKVYTGRRVTLDLKDAELANVFRLFADISGMNILVTDDVKGRITLRLVDVPWDQALDIILQTHNLGMEKVGNVIRISTLARLQKEKEAKAKAKKAEEVLEPLVMELIPVSYSKASELAPKVKDVLSTRGSVTVDERTNTLIVKDVADRVDKARDLVAKLDTQTPQVLIDAKIVEASSDFKKELGISWGGGYRASYEGDEVAFSGAAPGTMQHSGQTSYIVNLPASVSVGDGGAFNLFVGNLPARFFEVKLSAMERQGKGKVISSPRITTLDHKEAFIEQGVRIPYLKLTEAGTVSTEFIDATLKLNVTPHVTADGHIRMEIECSKETPDWSRQVQGQPTVKKSKARTEVMAKNGEVVVLGGIYEYSSTGGVHGVPGLKDVPLFGWLFKKKTREREKKELMIFILPRIVAPRELAARP